MTLTETIHSTNEALNSILHISNNAFINNVIKNLSSDCDYWACVHYANDIYCKPKLEFVATKLEKYSETPVADGIFPKILKVLQESEDSILISTLISKFAESCTQKQWEYLYMPTLNKSFNGYTTNTLLNSLDNNPFKIKTFDIYNPIEKLYDDIIIDNKKDYLIEPIMLQDKYNFETKQPPPLHVKNKYLLYFNKKIKVFGFDWTYYSNMTNNINTVNIINFFEKLQIPNNTYIPYTHMNSRNIGVLASFRDIFNKNELYDGVTKLPLKNRFNLLENMSRLLEEAKLEYNFSVIEHYYMSGVKTKSNLDKLMNMLKEQGYTGVLFRDIDETKIYGNDFFIRL